MINPNYTILITGAGSGLGQGLSTYFAKKNNKIIVTDISDQTCQKTVSMINSNQGQADTFTLDVKSERNVESLLEFLEERNVDILINNAGLQYVSKLEEFPQQKWDEIIDIMLKGTCLLTKAVLPKMKAQNFGRIINIGSIHSMVASPFKSAYIAAKHGILGFSKGIALETADTDITINTICPSYIYTPLVEGQIKNQASEHGMSENDVIQKIMLEPMPKKTFISVDEVGAAADFLISDMARNITGQTIVIDGGWTIR